MLEAFVKSSDTEELFIDILEKIQEFKENLEHTIEHVDEKLRTDDQIEAAVKRALPKVNDGHTPTDNELRQLILPLIPEAKHGRNGTNAKNGTNGKNGSPDTGEEIVKKIKSLKGKKRLSIYDLADLEWFKGQMREIQWSSAGIASSSNNTPSTGGSVSYGVPTGTINSSNKVFTMLGSVIVAGEDSVIAPDAVISYSSITNISTITYATPPQNNVFALIGSGLSPQVPSGAVNSSNTSFTATGKVIVAVVDSVIDVGAVLTYNSGTNTTTIVTSVPPQNSIYAF